MIHLRIIWLILFVLTCFSCRLPTVLNDTEKILMKDQWSPLDYPITWSFYRTLKTQDTRTVLEISIERFAEIFPSLNAKDNNNISVSEGFLVDALFDLLTLFSERKLPNYRYKTSNLEEYLEYQLVHDKDTLTYRYPIDTIPLEVLEIDSLISIVYFPHLITSE